MMAFFFFQRCGEFFESPEQAAKCVRMLGKKAFHFRYIKHVDVI